MSFASVYHLFWHLYRISSMILSVVSVTTQSKCIWAHYIILCTMPWGDIYFQVVFYELRLSLFLRLRLVFVHPLQDITLHQCLLLSSVCCLPNPGGSLLLCYVVLPSSAWSSPWSLPSPWLPLCAAFGPPVVLHSCYMTDPFPLLFQCIFYDINFFVLFLISEHGIYIS